MLFRSAFLYQRHLYGMVNALIVLVCADAHVIARLKIADFGGTARSIDIFGRARDRNGGDCLVVGLDNEIFVLDFPQHPGECSRAVGLLAGPRSLLASRLLASRIPLAGVSAAGGISATRISTTTGKNDLAPSGKAGQQEDGE